MDLDIIPITRREVTCSTCTCIIYDGNVNGIGLSSAFESPVQVMDGIISLGMDMNEATYRAGISNNKEISSSEGLVGLLTKGRVLRKDYTKQAIRMALIPFENPELYRRKWDSISLNSFLSIALL